MVEKVKCLINGGIKMVKKQEQQKRQGAEIPIDQALQMQFAKIGQLQFTIDIMTQQMIALENENKNLKAKLDKAKK